MKESIPAQSSSIQKKSTAQQPPKKSGKQTIQSKQGKQPPIRAKQRPINKTNPAPRTIDPFKAIDAPIQQRPNDTGLPDCLKSGVENLSGYSMDDVKVHYNSDKPAQLQAHAYAQGNDIHLATGQEEHLPHEAWQVVQQKQGGVQPTVQMRGEINVNDDVGLEKEADVMGEKAATQLALAKPTPQKTLAQNPTKAIVQRQIYQDDAGQWKSSELSNEISFDTEENALKAEIMLLLKATKKELPQNAVWQAWKEINQDKVKILEEILVFPGLGLKNVKTPRKVAYSGQIVNWVLGGTGKGIQKPIKSLFGENAFETIQQYKNEKTGIAQPQEHTGNRRQKKNGPPSYHEYIEDPENLYNEEEFLSLDLPETLTKKMSELPEKLLQCVGNEKVANWYGQQIFESTMIILGHAGQPLEGERNEFLEGIMIKEKKGSKIAGGLYPTLRNIVKCASDGNESLLKGAVGELQDIAISLQQENIAKLSFERNKPYELHNYTKRDRNKEAIEQDVDHSYKDTTGNKFYVETKFDAGTAVNKHKGLTKVSENVEPFNEQLYALDNAAKNRKTKDGYPKNPAQVIVSVPNPWGWWKLFTSQNARQEYVCYNITLRICGLLIASNDIDRWAQAIARFEDIGDNLNIQDVHKKFEEAYKTPREFKDQALDVNLSNKQIGDILSFHILPKEF